MRTAAGCALKRQQGSCPAQHLLLLSPDSHQARRHMPKCSGRGCLSACHVLHRGFNQGAEAGAWPHAGASLLMQAH